MELKNDLIFVRHAECVCDNTIANNLLPLTAFGIVQANEALNILQNQFDVVFCSTSLRAVETAKILAQGKEPIQDRRLLERGWGNAEGNGKETDQEAKNRFECFLTDILQKYEGKRILLVTHGSLIKLAQDVIEQKSAPRDDVNHCSIIKYNQNKQKVILKK